MEEISTSFCFICLLHLANEHGLKIESNASRQRLAGEPEDDDDEDDAVRGESDQKVGNLWGLKVYRDPNAPLSA